MFVAAIVVFIASRGFKTKRKEFSENMGTLTDTTTEENFVIYRVGRSTKYR